MSVEERDGAGNWGRFLIVGAACAALAACQTNSSYDSSLGVSASERVVDSGDPVPRGGGAYKVGRPYTIAGLRFVPREDPNYDEVGIASYYADDFHGRRTANGEIFDMNALTAAHPTLPMPTYVRVTNLENGKSVVVRVNDRGPFARGREIDLSRRTAELLGFKHQGTAKVRVQYVGPAPLDGNDEWLTTTIRDNGDLASPVRVADAAPEPPVQNVTPVAYTAPQSITQAIQSADPGLQSYAPAATPSMPLSLLSGFATDHAGPVTWEQRFEAAFSTNTTDWRAWPGSDR